MSWPVLPQGMVVVLALVFSLPPYKEGMGSWQTPHSGNRYANLGTGTMCPS